MAKNYKSKINRIRTFALSLIFIGFLIMYIGLFFRKSSIDHDDFYDAGIFKHYGECRCVFLDWNAFDKGGCGGLSKL